MTVDDTISFTVNVKNTGTREGQEVVRSFYISDKKSSLPRPVKRVERFSESETGSGRREGGNADD